MKMRVLGLAAALVGGRSEAQQPRTEIALRRNATVGPRKLKNVLRLLLV